MYFGDFFRPKHAPKKATTTATATARKRSESRKVLLVESGILDFGFRNTAQGIRNPTKDWNLEFKFH